MLTEIWSSVTDTIFCHFRPFFALLPHHWPRKLKFGKNVKNTWRYCPLTLLYDKWQSYDVWFLRYQARQKEFFVILGYFLPFYPSNSWKNENFKKKKRKKEKNTWKYHHFTKVYQNSWSYAILFLRCGVWRM